MKWCNVRKKERKKRQKVGNKTEEKLMREGREERRNKLNEIEEMI